MCGVKNKMEPIIQLNVVARVKHTRDDNAAPSLLPDPSWFPIRALPPIEAPMGNMKHEEFMLW